MAPALSILMVNQQCKSRIDWPYVRENILEIHLTSHPVCFQPYVSPRNVPATRRTEAMIVKNIQANLILAFRELVVRAGYNAYIYTGFAIRMAQTLRFGKEYHHRHPHLEREIRRRCMWSCLLMDILVSIDLCRPMAIQTDMISIQLPCPEAAFIFGEDHPSPTLTRLTECQHAVLDLLPYFIKSVVFLKAIDDHVRVWVVRDLCVTIEDEFFDPIETSLTAWIAQLPKRMSWSKHNFRMFCHLGQGSLFVSMHMVLSYSLCLLRQLHLPFVGTGIDNSDGLLSSRQTAAIHHCIHHASQITTIASILYEGDNADREMLRSPFTSLALMCAASIHIWNKHSADHIKATTASASSTHPIEPTPHQQLELLTQVLRSWQRSWPLARGCLDTISLLKQLYDVAYGVAPAPLDEDDAGATASGAEVDLDRTTAIRSGIYDLTGGPSLLSRWTQVLLAVQSESQPVKKEQAQAQLRTLCRHMLLKPQIASIGSEGSDVEGGFDGLTYLNSLEYGNWSGIQGDFDETAVTWEGLGHSFV